MVEDWDYALSPPSPPSLLLLHADEVEYYSEERIEKYTETGRGKENLHTSFFSDSSKIKTVLRYIIFSLVL